MTVKELIEKADSNFDIRFIDNEIEESICICKSLSRGVIPYLNHEIERFDIDKIYDSDRFGMLLWIKEAADDREKNKNI